MTSNNLIQETITLKELQVNGYHLLYLGVPEGPEIGRILKELLTKVIDGELENDYNVLMEYTASM